MSFFPPTCTGADRHHRAATPTAAYINPQITRLSYQQALYTEFHRNRSEIYKSNIMTSLSYRLVSGFRTEIRHQGYRQTDRQTDELGVHIKLLYFDKKTSKRKVLTKATNKFKVIRTLHWR